MTGQVQSGFAAPAGITRLDGSTALQIASKRGRATSAETMTGTWPAKIAAAKAALPSTSFATLITTLSPAVMEHLR
jgi:hypothetical protein